MASKTSKTGISKTAKTDPPRTGNVDPERPGSFDLAALVAGKLKPYRATRVTTHPELAGRLDGALLARKMLHDALDAAQDAPAAPEATKTLRMAQKMLTPDTDKIAAELERVEAEAAALYAEFDAEEWIEVRFDRVGARRKEQVRREAADDADGKPLDFDIMLAYFAEAGKVRVASDDADRDEDADWEPLTAAQWEVLIDEVGPTQAEQLDTLCGEVVHGGMVSADFSRRLSAYQLTLSS